MKPLTNIIVHCLAAPFGCVNVVRQWHIQRGFKDIGYHYVIQNGLPYNQKDYMLSLDGCIENGRALDADNFISDNEVGAHTLGYNETSIGIALAGPHPAIQPMKFTKAVGPELRIEAETPAGFTILQMMNLTALCVDLIDLHKIPLENVLGHYETESGKAEGKTCPEFNMSVFREKLLRPFFK